MPDLYQAQLLDHVRRPRHYGPIEGAQVHSHATNQSCGDEIDVYAKLDESGKVLELKFTGQGCVLSQATASIMCEAWEKKSVGELLNLKDIDVLNLVGIQPGPMRLNCVLLSLRSLQSGLKLWQTDSQS